MRHFARRSILQDVRAKLGLFVMMAAIGAFTLFATANTYEVITGDDVMFSSVVETISLTNDKELDAAMRKNVRSSYDKGDFGIPQKIKLPETKQHIEINPGRFSGNGWLAKAGVGQVFLTSDARQKVFGNAVIYLRYDTSTTQHLGDVLTDDMVNIVTTDGWQLGYRVTQTSSSLEDLDEKLGNKFSRITVVMVSDENGATKCFQAALAKVGERI